MLIFFTFVLILFNLVNKAYVITLLWLWFVIPTFPTAPVLQVLPAIGLLSLVQLCQTRQPLTAKILHDAKEYPDENGYISLLNAGVTFASNGIFLLFGYVLHLFM